jgi:zinc protease
MRYVLISFVILLLSAKSAFAGIFNPEHFTLKNGMEVYVIQNHRAPVVTHMVWYKAGSVDEEPGTYGAAHFLEHLMFKSKKGSVSEDFSKKVAKIGGNDNAFTFYEYTAYHQTVAVKNLPLVMEMEADRMRSIDVLEKDFETERHVIQEERLRRTEGKPYIQLRDRLDAVLWYDTPYAIPVIGFEQSINDITYRNIIDFHDKWYAPNNAILVVAGDITAEQLKPLAEEFYGKIPARQLPKRRPIKKQKLDCDAKIVLHHENVMQPKMIMSFPAPSYDAFDESDKDTKIKEIYSLKVLSEIMGESSVGKLYTKMAIEDKKALSIGTTYRAASRVGGIFMLYAIPAENVTSEEFESLVKKEIKTLLDDGNITEQDVTDAKQRLVSGMIYALDNPENAANTLGAALISGRHIDEIENWTENIESVSIDDVKAAAKNLFNADKAMAIGWVLPKEVSKN